LIEKYDFPALRFINADETGVSAIHQNPKVLYVKVKRQLGKLMSVDSRQNVTVLFFVNEAGHFILHFSWAKNE
jgi:hypothetical protein